MTLASTFHKRERELPSLVRPISPEWLIWAAGLFNPEARFMAADLAKRRTCASIKAWLILSRPLRPLDEAVVAAGENLPQYGLV